MPETLRELLERRTHSQTLDRATWLERVVELFTDVREWMLKYDQLQVEDWNVLVVDQEEKVNAPALTIHFADAQITIEPKGAEPWNLEAVSGTRAVTLELDASEQWKYAWRQPTISDFKPLTKESFADDIVRGLLA